MSTKNSINQSNRGAALPPSPEGRGFRAVNRMNITPFSFSFPPYLSTSWAHIASLQQVGQDAIEVSLINSSKVLLPNLSQEVIDHIFSCHRQSMEESLSSEHLLKKSDLEHLLRSIQDGVRDIVGALLKSGSNAMSPLGKALEHDPKRRDLLPLPEEMKNKILMLLNVIPKEDVLNMPPPQPGCNCMYCQLIRLLRTGVLGHIEEVESSEDTTEALEEDVKEEDLEFSQWVVTPVSEKLFSVRNKLDSHEEYRVFLGNPIGCTCGKANCEHIVAVLRS